jgi:hypothetical protein
MSYSQYNSFHTRLDQPDQLGYRLGSSRTYAVTVYTEVILKLLLTLVNICKNFKFTNSLKL